MTGLFITLEGGDGVGKSTHAARLEAWLTERGETVVRTREPGGTELGVEIRNMVLHRRGHIDARAEALLYAADRAHHVATLVRPALERGDVVLQDRYIDSSIAYQGSGRELSGDDIRAISMWATRDLVPDITIVLDLDVTESRRRIGETRDTFDRLENEAREFHERVRESFLQLAKGEPERFMVVDASRPVDEVAAEIRAAVERKLESRRAV